MSRIAEYRPGRRFVRRARYEAYRPVVGPNRTPVVLPQATAWGPGMWYAAETGKYHGTAVDSREPTWEFTVTPTVGVDEAANMLALNTAILAACTSMTGNTKIVMQAGANYDGEIDIRANLTDFWLGIVTSGAASLPTQSDGLDSANGDSSSRVRLSDAVFMPKIHRASNPGLEGLINTANAAKRVFVRGLHFDNPAAVTYTTIGRFFPRSDFANTAAYPEHIIMSQCIFDPGDFNRGRRAMLFGGRGLALVDSIGDHLGGDAECNLVLNVYGEGPVKVHNTWSRVAGAAINFMIGGEPQPDQFSGTFVTHNIECTQNYMDSPTYVSPENKNKNKVECKFGVNYLIQGNKFGPSNGGGQPGSILIRLSDQDYFCPYVNTMNVTVADNYVTGGYGGVNVIGYIDTQHFPTPPHFFETSRVAIVNNLIDKQDDAVAKSNTLAFWDGKLDFIAAYHNTCLGSDGILERPWGFWLTSAAGDAFTTPINENMTVRDNVFTIRSYLPPAEWFNVMLAEYATGLPFQQGQPAWDFHTNTANSAFINNLMTVGTVLPNSDLFDDQLRPGTDISDIGFTDYDGEDYVLTPSSLGYRAAADGFDVGFNHALFQAQQDRVDPTIS